MRAVVFSVVAITAACGRGRVPTLVWEGAGAPRSESSATVTAGLTTVAPGVRRGAWGEAADATYQILESAQAETPHAHVSHDLTVVLLRGSGVLDVEGRRHVLKTGDVVHIERGRVHAFAPDGNAIALAIFTPALTSSDYVAADALRNDPANAH